MSSSAWEWDETLYASSAAYYIRRRLPYPQEMADALRGELGLHGSGRLLDVGCGPGSITLLLAPFFDEVVGVDADAGMLAEGRREAERRRLANITWVHMRAEELPAGLGTFASPPSRSRSTGWIAGGSDRRSSGCSSPEAPGST